MVSHITTIQMLTQSNDILELIKLVELYPNLIDEKDNDGFTCLHWAAYHDSIDVMVYIVSSFPETLLLTTERLQTVVHLAVSQNSLRILQHLASKSSVSAIINFQNKWGETALHLASGQGSSQIIILLLQMGADESIRDKWGRTAGDVAIENGYEDRVFSDNMLNRVYVSLPKECIERVELPMQQPVVNCEFFNAVLARRQRMDMSESKTMTDPLKSNDLPPTIKVRHMFGDSIETLAGMTVSSSSDTLKIPPIAVTTSRVALSKLIEYPGDPRQMSLLLTSGTVDINGRDMFGLSALHKAAAWDKVDLLDVLLIGSESGTIDVNALTNNQDGFSALHMCVDSGAVGAARRLLADPRVDISLKDRHGRTPLNLAMILGNSQLIEILSDER
jgi:ankyrin repeat protein